ncbi:hypothetical protein F0562_011345 [Nyssa sinensis]|uniref:Uncharacterized protein n=1 Tax=Nyssa sinensis TaxID=561372 RepID=A0A5J5A6P9_9ASTE|nr:hypothetical protein F0562_011345 [Nyssa sinensis]
MVWPIGGELLKGVEEDAERRTRRASEGIEVPLGMGEQEYLAGLKEQDKRVNPAQVSTVAKGKGKDKMESANMGDCFFEGFEGGTWEEGSSEASKSRWAYRCENQSGEESELEVDTVIAETAMNGCDDSMTSSVRRYHENMTIGIENRDGYGTQTASAKEMLILKELEKARHIDQVLQEDREINGEVLLN